MIVTTVLRLRKVKLWPYTRWSVVETFKAVVWDPTARPEETKRKPVVRREGE